MRDRRRLALPPAANAAGAALSPLLAVAAVAYAEHGWHVLPLRARAKVPATPHGFKDATASSERVIEWWRLSANSNIGIATGPSGLLAIDLDGEEGRDAWADLAARNRGHAPTRIYETGTGGLHIWFSGDGPSTARRLGPGIDTRGRGGYVIAPPSVHPNGRAYRWLEPLVPVASAPGWLLDLLRPAPPLVLGERWSLPPGVEATSYGRAALNGLAADMLAAQEGTRHDCLNRLAFRAGRLIAAGEIAEEVVHGVLRDAALRIGLRPHEAERTIRDGFRAGRQYPAARVER